MLVLTIKKTITAHYYAFISNADGQTLLLTPMCPSSSGCSGNVEKIMQRQSWTNHLQYRIDARSQHYVVLLDQERHILAISPAFDDIGDLERNVTVIKRSLSHLHFNFRNQLLKMA